MYPFRKSPLPTLSLTPAADAGVRRSVQLEQNSFTYGVYILLRVVFVIGAANAASINNRGSAAAAFDLVGITENGFDRVVIDPRVAAFIGQMNAMSSISSSRLTSLVVGTYNLTELVPVFFANPNTMDPGETAFRERNPTAQSVVFVQLSNNAAANIAVAGGGGTVSVTSATASFFQVHNPNQKTLPYFVPFISQAITPITGTNTQQRINLMSDRNLAGVVISQENQFGEARDVLLGLSVLSDVRTYLGNQIEPLEELQRFQELSYGGAVYTPLTAPNNTNGSATALVGPHLALSFLHHGQLSTMIEPNETNLRIVASVQQSAVGVAASSAIRITTIEMVRDLQAYVAPGGGTRMVCDPNPLPWVARSAA
jgi:hypothetical protein